MPRRKGPPYFKLYTSLPNHRKTHEFAADPLLLGVYCNIGMMAIERFAPRTGDSFLCSGLDLQRLAGCQGVANARRRLGRLEAMGGPQLSQEGAGWRLTLANLAKRQGLISEVGTENAPPQHTTHHTPHTTPKYKQRDSPEGDDFSRRGQGFGFTPAEGQDPPPKPKAKAKAKGSLAPEALSDDQKKRLDKWNQKRKPPFTNEQLAYAWEAVGDASHKNEKIHNLDWVRAFQGYLRNGWPLVGYTGSTGFRPGSPEAQMVAALAKQKIESEENG